MHPKIEALMDEAENRYLKPEEMEALKHYAVSIAQSLKVYESLRDQEVAIFQPIADQLVKAFPDVSQEILERSLKQWLLVLRYCAMAMLLNDREFLQQRLLDWLKGLVQTHQTGEIEAQLYQLLLSRLKSLLSPQALALLQPFLTQAQTSLLSSRV
jgi:hypothetical protein